VAEGLNAAQIAERLEVSTHTTYEIAHSAGIVLGKKSRLAIAARVTRTAELARQGATSQQIAAELGVGVEVIKRYARDHPEIAIPADAASVVRTIDSTRIVISTIDAIDGIGSMFDHIDYSDLPGDQVEGWISVLTTSIRSLTTLKKHLKKEIQP
jgi:DNA-binding CsgD family transcriptional regulator